MAYSDETFFADNEIRDVAEHEKQIYAGAFVPKTVLFNNGLDQDITVNIYGCSKAKPSVLYMIVENLVIPAGTTDFQTLEDYFQCFIMKVKAVVQPTTGAFSSEMLMTSGNGN